MLSMNVRIPHTWMKEEEVIEFLDAYPEYTKTFDRAITHEESHSNSPNYYGWEWSDVGTMGSKLVRLVTNDMAVINFKSNRNTLYFLANREVIKKGLDAFEKKQLSKKLSESLDKAFTKGHNKKRA